MLNTIKAQVLSVTGSTVMFANAKQANEVLHMCNSNGEPCSLNGKISIRFKNAHVANLVWLSFQN